MDMGNFTESYGREATHVLGKSLIPGRATKPALAQPHQLLGKGLRGEVSVVHSAPSPQALALLHPLLVTKFYPFISLLHLNIYLLDYTRC